MDPSLEAVMKYLTLFVKPSAVNGHACLESVCACACVSEGCWRVYVHVCVRACVYVFAHARSNRNPDADKLLLATLSRHLVSCLSTTVEQVHQSAHPIFLQVQPCPQTQSSPAPAHLQPWLL